MCIMLLTGPISSLVKTAHASHFQVNTYIDGHDLRTARMSFSNDCRVEERVAFKASE